MYHRFILLTFVILIQEIRRDHPGRYIFITITIVVVLQGAALNVSAIVEVEAGGGVVDLSIQYKVEKAGTYTDIYCLPYSSIIQ